MRGLGYKRYQDYFSVTLDRDVSIVGRDNMADDHGEICDAAGNESC